MFLDCSLRQVFQVEVLLFFLSFLGPLAFKGDEYNGTVPPLELTSFSWTKV